MDEGANTMSMRKRIVLTANGVVILGGSAVADGKILLGPHPDFVTVTSIVGVNSDKAIVKFHRESDDEVEDCVHESE